MEKYHEQLATFGSASEAVRFILGLEKEAILCFKVDRIEEQIDVYWKQRAHANWLSKGDRNTSFFTNVARRDEG